MVRKKATTDEKVSFGEAFVPENLGSAPLVNLDGQSEPNNNRYDMEMLSGNIRTAPWGLQPSLESMCEEAGVDFDDLLDGYRNDEPDEELARRFGVSTKTVTTLKEHFEHYGIDSIVGSD